MMGAMYRATVGTDHKGGMLQRSTELQHRRNVRSARINVRCCDGSERERARKGKRREHGTAGTMGIGYCETVGEKPFWVTRRVAGSQCRSGRMTRLSMRGRSPANASRLDFAFGALVAVFVTVTVAVCGLAVFVVVTVFVSIEVTMEVIVTVGVDLEATLVVVFCAEDVVLGKGFTDVLDVLTIFDDEDLLDEGGLNAGAAFTTELAAAATPLAIVLPAALRCGTIANAPSAIAARGGPGNTNVNGPLKMSTTIPGSVAAYAPGNRAVSYDEGVDEPEPETTRDEHEMNSSGGDRCFAVSSCRSR
jgi:hypothetical protein